MVTIRMLKPEDAKAIRKLVLNYLKDTYEQGGEFLPTLDNAALFVQYAIEGAKLPIPDPCVVAEEDGKLVGLVIARGIDFFGAETRNKTVRSWGTYVLPEYRSKGVGIQMFIIAGRLARLAGYDRFLGMTYGTGYEEHALGVVGRVPGLKEVGKVVIMDLSRKARNTIESTTEVHHEQ